MNDNLNDLDINSGYIFREVRDSIHWKFIESHIFFQEKVFSAYTNLLLVRKIVTARYRETEDSYFQNYEEVRYPMDMQRPFPKMHYILEQIGDDKRKSIIEFDEDCLVNPSDTNYDLFFALKVYVTDPFELDQFLNYQYELSFNDNVGKYQDFLQRLSIKYKVILSDYFILIEKYLIGIKGKGAQSKGHSTKQNLELSGFFKSVEKYNFIINLLVEKKLIDRVSLAWLDERKGLLAAIIKELHKKRFYKENRKPTNPQIKKVCMNTFAIDISIDTVKKSHPKDFFINYIPTDDTP
jgi:hypothetical protein